MIIIQCSLVHSLQGENYVKELVCIADAVVKLEVVTIALSSCKHTPSNFLESLPDTDYPMESNY